MIAMQRLIHAAPHQGGQQGAHRHVLPGGLPRRYGDREDEVNFRLLYDTDDRFALHKVVKEEVSYKLCHVKKVLRGPKGVP